MSTNPGRLELIENLPAFLAHEGLEVVRAEWGPNWSYPVLLVRPVAPPSLEVCAFCEHAQALHEGNRGRCCVIDCACEVFTPPLEEG